MAEETLALFGRGPVGEDITVSEDAPEADVVFVERLRRRFLLDFFGRWGPVGERGGV